jgi:hypothetical protein
MAGVENFQLYTVFTGMEKCFAGTSRLTGDNTLSEGEVRGEM